MDALIRDLLEHFDEDGQLGVGHSSKEFNEWIDSFGLPVDLSNIFKLSWPQRDGMIGHFNIDSAPSMMESKRQPILKKHGLLLIGGALNGDFLVVRLCEGSYELGLVSHEEFWDHQDSLWDIYQPIAGSLAVFLCKLADRKYVPRDYFAARDYNALRKEISREA